MNSGNDIPTKNAATNFSVSAMKWPARVYGVLPFPLFPIILISFHYLCFRCTQSNEIWYEGTSWEYPSQVLIWWWLNDVWQNCAPWTLIFSNHSYFSLIIALTHGHFELKYMSLEYTSQLICVCIWVRSKYFWQSLIHTNIPLELPNSWPFVLVDLALHEYWDIIDMSWEFTGRCLVTTYVYLDLVR